MGKKRNFGKWELPTSWDGVTLRQVQALDRSSGVVEVISVLSGRSVEEVSELPVTFVESMMGAMSFLGERPEFEPSCSCVIGGERYEVNPTEELTLGEFVAVESVLQADPNDAAGVLSVVCRRPGEAYDTRFENTVAAERREMFLDAPCTASLPVISFFLLCWSTSRSCSRRCSLMKEEAQGLIAESIATLSSGGGGAGFFGRRSAARKLRRLSEHIGRTF